MVGCVSLKARGSARGQAGADPVANPKVIRRQTLSALVILLLALAGGAHAQIVAFGASNVSGWNVAASEAFPAQLQAMLRAKGYDVKVTNAGIYGNTTTDMLNRMDSDIPAGTTIVILDISGGVFNDSWKGISREQGDADMAAITAKLKARDIKIIPFSGAELAAQYHQQDGLHLTPEGHKLVATKLLPELTEALGPPPEPPRSVKEACMADARRLCAKVLGDDEKRHACMREHKSELSKDCLHAIAASREH
jgi:acyl-CoA thioesterase I